MKNIKLLIIFIFGFLFQGNAQDYRIDSTYYLPKNAFWDFVLSKKDLKINLLITKKSHLLPIEHTLFKNNAQELIIRDNIVLINISQTGFLYEFKGVTANQVVFKRIDQTININYNIGCTYFIDHNDIYSLGGYGFWKSNGTLRKFNRVDKEWDIMPLNKEVFPWFAWYADFQSRVYVPFENEINAGVVNQIKGVIRPTAYFLDLKEKKWNKLGPLNSNIKKLITEDLNYARTINTKNGFLVLLNSEEMYLFDFINNKISKSKNLTVNQFLLRKMDGNYAFIYHDTIYTYDPVADNLLTMPFIANDFLTIAETIWDQENDFVNFIIIALAVIILLAATILIIRKSIKKKLEAAQLKMLKSKSIDQAFNETELSLIHLLLQSFDQNSKVEIYQINHVLGIKDKNIGLQKKVRSDVMNSINNKYQLIAQTENLLISSIRKEEDKRFFEYFITASEIKSIQRLLKK